MNTFVCHLATIDKAWYTISGVSLEPFLLRTGAALFCTYLCSPIEMHFITACFVAGVQECVLLIVREHRHMKYLVPGMYLPQTLVVLLTALTCWPDSFSHNPVFI